MANLFVWTDIPVKNLDRAIKFYSNVLAIEIKEQKYPDFSLGLFPENSSNMSGCLYVEKKEIAAEMGPLLYFNVDGRIDDAARKITEYGGTILAEKQPIGEYGFRVIAKDSEGNRIALHSTKG